MARGSKDWLQAAPVKSLLQLLREGNCFAGGGYGLGAAAKFTEVELWNPSGSGVDVYLYELSAWSSVAAFIDLTKKTNVLTGSSFTSRNAKIDGENSDITVISGTVSTPAVWPPYTRVQLTADVLFRQQNLNIWIPEGYGVALHHPTVNTDLYGLFRWYEFVDY